MRLNALAGMPRSGSTLLANILAQHPEVHASGTSTLSPVINAVTTVLSNNPDLPSELAANEGMEARYASAVRGLIEGWYAGIKEPVIVDKGRTWPQVWLLARKVDPEAKMLVTVRDPRDVVASIEKQNRATAMFQSPIAPSLRDAADNLMSPEGMVGGPIRMIEDMIDRNAQTYGVLFVPFETFVIDPQTMMDRISKHLDLKPHKWNFEKVDSQGLDLDEVWRGKYPHGGSGPVAAPEGSWSDYLPSDLADLIAGVYPKFMQRFSYS